ncbi:energy transducer TonB [Sphingomonas piscis]|uniref:Energy transducer TonB n=1 Tax=Sphingomonas piscis TaxID=2714943 RepID=A0A6G7YLZ1_9SPHN|nr:energy transducer TonB [Sphingomonas piscis]QIK77759.1 energy transducer TonB [Sphingomonas piscis]
MTLIIALASFAASLQAASEAPVTIVPGQPVSMAGSASAASKAGADAKPKLLDPQVLKAEDYPDDALQRGEQGSVVIRLTVDPAGKVTDCNIATSSKSASLDAVSCRVYAERAQYEPATNAKARSFTETVTWRMGQSGPSRHGWFHRMSVLIHSTGEQTDCKIESSEQPDSICRITTAYSGDRAARLAKEIGSDPYRQIIESRFLPVGEPMVEPVSRS